MQKIWDFRENLKMGVAKINVWEMNKASVKQYKHSGEKYAKKVKNGANFLVELANLGTKGFN